MSGSQAGADTDIAFLGHYTKDTIVSAAGMRVVDGGAFNYGAHVAARMGLSVAAVTRLAVDDFHVVDALRRLGVDVFARATPESTCLRIEYPARQIGKSANQQVGKSANDHPTGRPSDQPTARPASTARRRNRQIGKSANRQTTIPDERTITITNTAGPFTPAEVRDLRAGAFVVGASVRGEVGLEVIEELAKREALLALDVQGFVRVAREGRLVYQAWPEEQAVLGRVDVLKADAVEAEMLTGEADVRAAARALAGLGPAEVVLTHRDGVLVYAGGRCHEAGFFPRRLVGRTGRGDTCIAAYVARRLAAPPAGATTWAAAVTSLKMEAEGPFRRDIREVEDLIQRRYG